MAKHSINFTKAILNALPMPAPGKRAIYHDSKVQGLQLRVTDKGAKTFSVFKWLRGGGRAERVTLGKYPQVSIEQARAAAFEAASELANGRSVSSQRRAHAQQRLTFGELFDRVRALHQTPAASTWKDYEWIRDKFFRRFEHRQLIDITPEDVAALHASLRDKPRTANKVINVMSAIYGRGRKLFIWRGENPAKDIQRFPEVQRERFLQAAELPYFFEALNLDTNSIFRDFVLLALLTGARRSNVLAMRWNDIDLETGEWTIPKTKNGKPQTIPLSTDALALLNTRRALARGDYVLPGPGKDGYFKEPKKGWERTLIRAETLRLIDAIADRSGIAGQKETRRAELAAVKVDDLPSLLAQLKGIARSTGLNPDAYGLGDLRIHDLRRTLGSWQAKEGASLVIIGKSLGHRSLQSTTIYARIDRDPVRKSVERATRSILAAANGKAPGPAVAPSTPSEPVQAYSLSTSSLVEMAKTGRSSAPNRQSPLHLATDSTIVRTAKIIAFSPRSERLPKR